MERTHAMRNWRAENGITLTDLAAKVKVTASHLSEIERGKNRPSLQLAAKLSRKTGIPLTKFVEAAE